MQGERQRFAIIVESCARHSPVRQKSGKLHPEGFSGLRLWKTV